MKRFTKNLFLSFVTALALAPQVVVAMEEFKEEKVEEKEREVKEPITSSIENIPRDILRHIICPLLPLRDQINLRKTSQTMRKNINEETIIKKIPDQQKRQALLTAAQTGTLNIIQFMFNNQQFMNHIDNPGARQSLAAASQAGHLNVVELMLGNPQFMNHIGWAWDDGAATALLAATQAGQQNIIELMLGRHQFMNRIGNQHAGRALLVATQTGQQNIVQLMLDAPQFIIRLNNIAATNALLAATQAGHLNIVQSMLGNQQFMNNIDFLTATIALSMAARANNQHLVNFMLSNQKFVSIFSFGHAGIITQKLMTLHQNSLFTAFKVFFSYLKSWPLFKKFVLPTFGFYAAIFFGILIFTQLISLGAEAIEAASLGEIGYRQIPAFMCKNFFDPDLLKALGLYGNGLSAFFTFRHLAY